MINIGVDKVICHCGAEMKRVGGVFGGYEVIQKDTFVCSKCNGYVLVLVPNEKHQQEFQERLK